MGYKSKQLIREQRGFTLIELMIVVAIIGILASVGISSYRTYTIRAQVAEGFSLASNAKTPVVDAYLTNGEAPANRTEAGLTADASDTFGKFVTALAVNNGRIDITYGNSASALIENSVLTLTPYETVNGGVVWRCGAQDAPTDASGTDMQTLGTKGNGNAAVYDAGDVDLAFLPATCR